MSAAWLYFLTAFLWLAAGALHYARDDAGAVWIALAALFFILGVQARKPERKTH